MTDLNALLGRMVSVEDDMDTFIPPPPSATNTPRAPRSEAERSGSPDSGQHQPRRPPSPRKPKLTIGAIGHVLWFVHKLKTRYASAIYLGISAINLGISAIYHPSPLCHHPLQVHARRGAAIRRRRNDRYAT